MSANGILEKTPETYPTAWHIEPVFSQQEQDENCDDNDNISHHSDDDDGNNDNTSQYNYDDNDDIYSQFDESDNLFSSDDDNDGLSEISSVDAEHVSAGGWPIEEPKETDWTWWGDVSVKSAIGEESWDPVANQLFIQRTSECIIATRFASFGFVIGDELVKRLKTIEDRAQKKIDQRAITSTATRRRERTFLIDSTEELQSLLDKLSVLDHTQPKVVVDCEGLNFQRTGTIDIMELFVRPHDKLYLIDVVALGKSAWSTNATNADFSLAQFLSSPTDKKVMWDLRMDAHILNKLYGIRLRGIVDSSLWAIAYRVCHSLCSYNGFHMSIETACDEHLQRKLGTAAIRALREAKRERASLPPRPWAIRPLPKVLIDYAADVKYMGMIYDNLRRSFSRAKYAELVEDIEYYTEQELEIASDPYWPADIEREPVSPFSADYLTNARENLALRRGEAEGTYKFIETPADRCWNDEEWK